MKNFPVAKLAAFSMFLLTVFVLGDVGKSGHLASVESFAFPRLPPSVTTDQRITRRRNAGTPTTRTSTRKCRWGLSSSTTSSEPTTTTPPAVEPTSADDDLSQLSQGQLKDRLVDLIPKMTGQQEEFRLVERLVNELEEGYQPTQTLQFLNLVMQGDWQLIFSTNLAGTPNPLKFRLRELVQRVDCDGLEGNLTNVATWDLSEQADGQFDHATGTFSAKCSYRINQGARMVVQLNDHVLQPSRGSAIPDDVPALVGLLHRSMPKELFDPSEHAADTTYLDGDLRIVRWTGPRLEGIRDIFVRKGSIELDPTMSSED